MIASIQVAHGAARRPRRIGNFHRTRLCAEGAPLGVSCFGRKSGLGYSRQFGFVRFRGIGDMNSGGKVAKGQNAT